MMKNKKSNKKLALDKVTVSNLEQLEMEKLRGGNPGSGGSACCTIDCATDFTLEC
jgi:hypothetical protein